MRQVILDDNAKILRVLGLSETGKEGRKQYWAAKRILVRDFDSTPVQRIMADVGESQIGPKKGFILGYDSAGYVRIKHIDEDGRIKIIQTDKKVTDYGTTPDWKDPPRPFPVERAP